MPPNVQWGYAVNQLTKDILWFSGLAVINSPLGFL